MVKENKEAKIVHQRFGLKYQLTKIERSEKLLKLGSRKVTAIPKLNKIHSNKFKKDKIISK